MNQDLPPTRKAVLDLLHESGGHLTMRTSKDTVLALGVFMAMVEDGILERVPNDHLAEFSFRLKTNN